MFCHKCGFELPEGSSFCPNCGVPVAGVVPPAPPESAAQPDKEQESRKGALFAAKRVSEHPSRPAARRGRWRPVTTVLTVILIGLLAFVLFLVYHATQLALVDRQEPGPVVSTKLPATIAGRLTGLPSFEGAASLRTASLRVVRPETGEVAAAILLAESLDYKVQVPAGLYILIATIADAQSGKQYLGFSQALRVEGDETRQLDISMESSLVSGQPGFSTELGLVKYLRTPRVFATALSYNIALTAPYTVSREVSNNQSLPAGRTPIVTIRQPFKITAGCQFNYTYSASTVVFTELFKATRDKNIFVDTGPAFQKAVQEQLEAQRQGKINPKTWIDYRPLSPYYEVRGEVCAERIYTDPETGLATVEGDWSMKLELVHIETKEVLATRKASGERVNTRDFFALTVTKFVPEFMGAIMEKEAAAVTSKGKTTGPQTWQIVTEGQTAVITVDAQGNFSGSGWVTRTSKGKYPMPITNGRMSGTSITFQFSGSWDSKGLISGSGSGTLNAPFPSATSASGSISHTSSHPNMGTRTFKYPWTATRVK